MPSAKQHSVSVASLMPLDHWHLAEPGTETQPSRQGCVEPLDCHVVVKNRSMVVVNQVLVHLQPVTGVDVRERNKFSAGRQLIAIIDWELRLQFRRTQIREHNAVTFKRRVCTMTQRVFNSTLSGLAGGFEDRPIDVIKPAVVAAANPALLDDPEFK